jgi:xanthosine utilization system XapX-like protein
MTSVLWSWLISAAVLLVLAAVLGAKVRKTFAGILIDSRERYSLSQFQVVVWTIVLLSLAAGIVGGRLLAGVDNPLDFTIPAEVLGLLGISIGSTVASSVIKSAKDTAVPNAIAAGDPPQPRQMFTTEEGPLAGRLIDIVKFQNFVLTVLLVVAYTATAISVILRTADPDRLSTMPGFSGTYLTLLGISHAGYLTGKLPSPGGVSTTDTQVKAPGKVVADLRTSG